MSFDLYQQETADRVSQLNSTDTLEASWSDDFLRGSGMATMRGFAKAGRAATMPFAVGAMAQDALQGTGTEMQDRFFKQREDVFQSAVDYWTPRANEIGVAGEVVGSLVSMLPLIFASPAFAVGAQQLTTAEDLVREGVGSGKAQAVGAVQAAGLGLGIWMPILGRNLVERVLVGGAGFNVLQGGLTRAGSQAILGDVPQAKQFDTFDPAMIGLDALLGAAFGGFVHLSPAQRAQGAEALGKIKAWAQNLQPTEIAALATLREAQHLNADSLPGKAVAPQDLDAHVVRMRAAIDQMARGEAVQVDNLPKARVVPDVARVDERAQVADELVQSAGKIMMEEGIAPARAGLDAAPPTDRAQYLDAGAYREQLRSQYVKDGEVIANSRKVPFQGELPPVGTWRIDDYAGIHGHEVAQLRVIQIDDLITPERDANGQLEPAKRPDIETYGAFLEAGSRPPPVEVLETDRGTLNLTDGHRRVEAARAAGKSTIEAWVSPIMDHPEGLKDAGNGRPIRVGQTFEAAQNRPAGIEPAGNEVRPEGPPVRGEAAAPEVPPPPPDGVVAERAPAVPEAVRPIYERVRDQLDTLTNLSPEQRDAYAKQMGAFYEATAKRAGVTPDDLWQRFPMRVEGGQGLPESALMQDPANWWYSELARRVDTVNMKSAPVKGWKDWIKSLNDKGLKEEIKWSGLEEWLDLQPGKVTREQVADYLKVGGVKVSEAMLGSGDLKDVGKLREFVERISEEEGADPDAVMEVTAAYHRLVDGDTSAIGDLEQLGVPYDVLHGAGAYTTRASVQGAPKFSQYVLPGGESYRELLLTLPTPDATFEPSKVAIERTRSSVTQGGFKITYDGKPMGTFGDTIEMNKDGQWEGLSDAKIIEIARKRFTGSAEMNIRPMHAGFNSSHFSGHPNILAHVRFNERTDADGKRVLFVEEFQSDWAQQGRKEGFRDRKPLGPASAKEIELKFIEPAEGEDPKIYPGYWESFDRRTGVMITRHGGRMSEEDVMREAIQYAHYDAQKRQIEGTPQAPFVGKTDSWLQLSVKRMVSYAAENGFDRIAWTRGEQQVERYTTSLRKAVDAIEWKKTADGIHLVGFKGKKPSDQPKPEPLTELPEPYALISDQNSHPERRYGVYRSDQAHARFIGGGHPTEAAAKAEALTLLNNERAAHWADNKTDRRTKVVDTTEKETALSDAIGKAMADQIVADPAQHGTIEGDGIRIDDTGMAGFYDRILPGVAKDVLKKLGGGKLGEVAFHEAPAPDPAKPWEVFNSRDGHPVEAFATEAEARAAADARGELFDFARRAEGWTHAETSTATGKIGNQPGFDITDAMRAKAAEGLPLFQKPNEAGGPRGYYIGPEDAKIGLLSNADESTFLHESGHFYLDVLSQLAREHAEIRTDVDQALKWLGVKDLDTWQAMPLEEKRPFHEKWARGFEQYLGEGNAPSIELEGPFAKFKAWLTEVYGSLKNLGVEISDEVRVVMARMLGGEHIPMVPKSPDGAEVWKPMGIDAPEVRADLEFMAKEEAGWAEIGGKLIRTPTGERAGEEILSRTQWIPKADWWPGRPGPKKLNEAAVQEAVRKALAGEPLNAREQRTVDYMVDTANDHLRAMRDVGGADEWDAVARDIIDAELPPSTQNIVDADLVARASLIDEGAVERAAIQHEQDDGGFMAAIREIVNAKAAENAKPDPAAPGSGQGNRPAPDGRPEGQGNPGGQRQAGERGADGRGQPDEGTAGSADPVRRQAERFAAAHPDLPIRIGTNPDGSPITITPEEFLAQSREASAQAREDATLFEAAAECLLGGGA